MFKYHYLNKISAQGDALWTEDFQKTDDLAEAEAIVVRSAGMHEMQMPESLQSARWMHWFDRP